MLAPAVALQRQKCRGEAAASSSARVWSVAGSRCTEGASPSPTRAYTCCSAVPSCTGGPASSICMQYRCHTALLNPSSLLTWQQVVYCVGPADGSAS